MAMFDEIGELLTGGSNLGALSGFLGENDNAARSAVGASVPILLGGMAKRSRSNDGAKAMFDLVSSDNGSLLDNIGGFLGGGDSGGLGSNLVSAMLGSRRSAVEEGLASSTGLGLGTITKFLPMMAPLVMSYLGRKAQSDTLDQPGLARALRSERDSMEKGGLGGLLGLLDGDDEAGDDAGFISGLSRLAGLGGLGALGGGALGAMAGSGSGDGSSAISADATGAVDGVVDAADDASSGISGKAAAAGAAGLAGAAAVAAGAGGLGDKLKDGVSGIAGKLTGGDADLPDVELSAPDVDLPDVDLPDVDLPDVDLPNVDLPDVDLKAPDVDMPDVDMPDVDMPDVDMPDVEGKGISGKVVGGAAAAAAGVAGIAAVGGGKLGDLAGKAKDIVTPDVDLPNVDLPDVDLPDVDLPDVDLKAPDVDLPDVDLPDVDLPDVDLPDVDLKAPDVDLPDVDLPDVDLPDVDMPEAEGKGISGKVVGGAAAAAAGVAGIAAVGSGKLGDLGGKAKDIATPDIDITKPKVEVTKPKVTKPKVEVTKPKVTKPEVTKPKLNKPDLEVTKPKVTTGKAGAVKASGGDGGAYVADRAVGGGKGGWGWLKWLLPLLLLLALLALLLWACNRDSGTDTATDVVAPVATATSVPATATAVPATATAVPATAVPATAVPAPTATAVPAPTATSVPEPTAVPEPAATCASLIDVATEAGLTTLVTAVQAAGAAELLTTSGPLTIFAPTDEAFGKLPPAVTAAALADTDLLTQLLTYHVVGGAVTSGDISTGSVATVGDANVYLRSNADGVRVNNANVVAADVEADECVVHVIDNVLVPPALLATVGGTLNDAVGGGVIKFNRGTATLTDGSVDTLNAICGYLGGQPVDVSIGGIAVASNTDRAQQRSDAVRDHLIECGLSADQVEALIISINDADGSNLNLLVEFTG